MAKSKVETNENDDTLAGSFDFEEPSSEEHKPKKPGFLRRYFMRHKTRLYFLAVILAAYAVFATIFYWPAAFALTATAFTTVAALTVSGFAPFAFLAGLGVFATALIAAAIVLAAGITLFVGAKIAMHAANWVGHKLLGLLHKGLKAWSAQDDADTYNITSEIYASNSSPHSGKPDIEIDFSKLPEYASDESEHLLNTSSDNAEDPRTESDSENDAAHNPSPDDSGSNLDDDLENLNEPPEEAGDFKEALTDTDTLENNEPSPECTRVATHDFIEAFKQSITTTETKVRRKLDSDGNLKSPDTKSLNSDKVVLLANPGVEYSHHIKLGSGDSLNNKSPQDLICIATKNGHTFFRGFNKNGPDGKPKEAIPVEFVAI